MVVLISTENVINIEAVSLFLAANILWVLSFCVTCVGHYAPDYAHAPRKSAVLRQRGNPQRQTKPSSCGYSDVTLTACIEC